MAAVQGCVDKMVIDLGSRRQDGYCKGRIKEAGAQFQPRDKCEIL